MMDVTEEEKERWINDYNEKRKWAIEEIMEKLTQEVRDLQKRVYAIEERLEAYDEE